MAALTRILNNQIYNATIVASQKIVPGSIVGSLFASNVTVPGDFIVTGNLMVLGSSAQTTIASTNTYVNDPLIVLNNGFAGTNSYDEGFIFNRGTAQNQAIIWSEYFKEFRIIGTTDVGTTYGNVSASNFGNLHVGNLIVDYATTFGTLSVVGAISGASLNVTGNVLASTIRASYSTASTMTVGNIAAVNFGNTGAIYTGASINLSGNVEASTIVASYVTASTATIGNISAVTIGNTGAYLNGGTLNISGNTLLGLTQATAINSTPIGNITASTGAFTTLTSSGITTVTNTTQATASGSGAFQVIGGASIGGNLWIGGNLNVLGNNFTISGNIGVFYGNTAGFGALYAGIPGFTPLPFTVLQTTSNYNNYTQNNFQNINTGNQASTDWVATSGTGTDTTNYIDMGITTASWDGTQSNSLGNALLGNDGYLYVQGGTGGGNLVIGSTSKSMKVVAGGAGSAYIVATFNPPNTASTSNTTGALVVTGGVGISDNLYTNTANVSSTLWVSGASTLNNTLSVAGATTLTAGTNATSPSAGGTLTVTGGAAFSQDVYIGGNLVVANIISQNYQILSVSDPLLYLNANVVYPYNYDIGFFSHFIGNGLSTLANVYQHTGVVRDNADNTWKFFSNVSEPSGGTVTFNSNTVYDPIKAGNLFLVNTTNATNNSTGALIVTGGAGIGASLYARDIQSTVIGNVTPASAFFTTVNVTGNVLLGLTQASAINATPIGNATASTGAFTTLSASAGIWANSTTASTNTTTGALVVAGGLGLAGNIYQGGAYYDSSSSNFILAPTPTTVNVFSAGTTVFAGAASGDFVIRNPNIDSVQATLNLFNANVTTMNFAGTANVTMGASSGVTTLQGGANIRATTGGNTFTNGALVVAGSVGVAGNVSIPASSHLTIGQEISSFPVPQTSLINVIANIQTSVARVSLTNLNFGGGAEYQINAANVANNMAIGIVSANSANTILSANDGYIGTSTGNLYVLSGLESGITVGGPTASNLIVKFSSLNSNVSIYATKPAVTPTSAALTVAGGLGVNSNISVNGGAIINYGQSNQNFVVQGAVTTSLIVANSNYGALVFGGSNVSPTLGAVAKFNSTDSIQLPVGTSSQRPSGTGNVDLQGMMRFNSTINNIEYFDGSAWQSSGSSFTVISDRQFSGNSAYGNVDGTNTTFTIQSSSTTSSAIVSINGVMQFPVLAYSISGTTLTFTEPPALNDVIDVRVLATTTVVSTLASANGLNQFIADTTGATIYTGTSSTVERIQVDPVGNFNFLTGNKVTYTQANVNIAASGVPYVIDSWSQNSYSTGKYVINAQKDRSNFESYEAMVLTDSQGNAYVTVYGVVNNGTGIGTLSANVVGSNVQVYYTSTSLTNANVVAMGTFIV